MKKLNNKTHIILIIIICLAIFIRVMYVSKTNISDYQYDVGIGEIETEEDYNKIYENFDKEKNEGRHINYIMQLYIYNKLPNKIVGQFYHPPLHHFIMSTWLKIMDNISNNSIIKFESMQLITLTYSIIIIITLYKILKEVEIENKIIPMILFGFYPLYIFQSGSINNDQLVIMFSILCFLYLLRWKKHQTLSNTIKIALCIGLGCMTKTSMFVMIFPTIYIYFKVLNEYVKENKKVKKLILELLIFSIITIPLALWFQIRNLYNGLNTIGIISPYEYLSVRNESLWNRYGITNPFNINSVNIWNRLIFTTISFGETINNEFIFYIMIILNILLVINFIYYFFKNYKKNEIICITCIIYFISYIGLNISMPYICSSNARYMVVPISLSFIIIADGLKSETKRWVRYQIYFSTISIMIFSIILFTIFI